jgi:hypothetical protein
MPRRLSVISVATLATSGLVPLLVLVARAYPQSGVSSTVSTSQLTGEIDAFLKNEMAAHIADIKKLPQERVVGALTTGEFSWGTFLRAAAVIVQPAGEKTIAGRDVAKFLGQAGLIEARAGGKTFAQLYAGLALRQYGTDLKTNELWQSLTPSEQAEWRSLLDPARFYDRQARHVVNLPENYFGVAARVATMDYQMGIITDRAFVDDLLELAAAQFLKGATYSDDALPTGRFDRYSQEYERYVYEAAENAGRKDILAKLEPSMKTQLRLWWDLVDTTGYGFPWGRSLGDIDYMDTLEIVGFVAEHPQFRPAPLPQLASAYNAAWKSLMHDYLPQRHLLNVFGFGHGHYSYINPEREWQQTTAFFGKAANAEILFKKAMREEHIESFPARLDLPNVDRFEYFRKGDRPAGVWVVRNSALQFALPITTGTKPGVADYLAAPHGLIDFSAPVEQVVPVMVPFIELADGRVIVAADGADEIQPGPTSLRALWRRWVLVGGKPADFVEPGLTAEVAWSIAGGTFTRQETIKASHPVAVRRLWMMFPTTSDRVTTVFPDGLRRDRLGSLEIDVMCGAAPCPAEGGVTTSVRATGDSALGRGNLGPIPLVLEWERSDFTITPEKPFRWQFRASLQRAP